MTRRALGVDGCRGGWVVADTVEYGVIAVVIDDDDALIRRLSAGDLETVVCIDVPIGLPDATPRSCDIAARAELGAGRKSSVFSPPARSALWCQTYRDALERNREAMGVGLSKQAFHLLPRIRLLDDFAQRAFGPRLFETHPELAFHRLAGAPLPSKHTRAGRQAREALLAAFFSDRMLAVGPTRQRLGRRNLAEHDLLDAMMCLSVAERVLDGRISIPAAPTDSRGLPMRIVG